MDKYRSQRHKQYEHSSPLAERRQANPQVLNLRNGDGHGGLLGDDSMILVGSQQPDTSTPNDQRQEINQGDTWNEDHVVLFISFLCLFIFSYLSRRYRKKSEAPKFRFDMKQKNKSMPSLNGFISSAAGVQNRIVQHHQPVPKAKENVAQQQHQKPQQQQQKTVSPLPPVNPNKNVGPLIKEKLKALEKLVKGDEAPVQNESDR